MPPGEDVILEAGHTHCDECYFWIPAEEPQCGLTETEGHSHSSECYTLENTLTCTLAEGEGHSHGESCYDETGSCICGEEERSGHAHCEECYAQTEKLICGQEEIPAHAHTEGCYPKVRGDLICEEEEREPVTEPGEPVLICEKREAKGHIHKEGECFLDHSWNCGKLEVRTHQHTAECFQPKEVLTCQIPEHIHEDKCWLTEEEQRQVEDVICLIESFPPVEEIRAEFDRLAEDPDGLAGYREKILSLVKGTFDAYNALSDIQKNEVTNADRLSQYGWILEEPSEVQTVTAQTPSGLALTLTCAPNALPYPAEEIVMTAEASTDSLGHSLMEQILANDGLEALEISLLDISLWYQGEPLEPVQSITVTIGIARQDVHGVKVYHIDTEAGTVEDMNARLTASGDVAFETDHFSYYGVALLAENSEAMNLKDYVTGKNGEFKVELLDENGGKVEGNEVYLDKGYKISLGIGLPNEGFEPGIYTYQLPGTLKIKPQTNIPVTNSSGETFGSWSVDESGLITFIFDPLSNQQQNVSITIDMEVEFTKVEEVISFDGDVSFTVRPNPEQEEKPEPKVSKSGKIDVDENGNPTEFIKWYVSVQGGEGMPLPGTTVTDTLPEESGSRFTEDSLSKSDYVELYVGKSVSDGYYSYYIKRSEITVREDGTQWSYTVPETVTCRGCNDPQYNNGVHQQHPVTVEDDWRIQFFLYTKIDENANPNTTTFTNTAEAGRLNNTAIVKPPSEATGVIQKSGRLVNGVFQWEIEATIPGSETPSHYWYLWDSMKITNTNPAVYPNNDIHLAKVTATFVNGTQINVPLLKDAAEDDPFALVFWWKNIGTTTEAYDKEISILHQCVCTEDTCAHWESSCRHREKGTDGTVFCRCWPEKDDVTFTFVYETENSAEIISDHGGLGRELQNSVSLNNKVINGTECKPQVIASSSAKVPIPGVFTKAQITNPSEANAYTADFRVTVNEERQDLSTSDAGVTIVDTMSETLFYISGTMVVKQVDSDGTETVLHENADYSLTVENDRHKLSVKILNPGPYMYVLEYSAAINVTEAVGSIDYSNSATVELLGNTYTATSGEQHLTSYSSTAETFKLQVCKVDAYDKMHKLPNAEFGLYMENGNLIAAGSTDENGVLVFETRITEGIKFCKDVPYYVQERKAPDGYIEVTPKS